jgi:[protein-PII] uridylyltransferase
MPSNRAARTDVPEITRRVLAARERAAAGIKAGTDGVTLSRALSDDIDAVICDLAGPLIAACSEKVAILATGGFGRRELAPFSDLDLLCLCADEPGAQIVDLARKLLPPLWGAKVDAGHAVRSYKQALALPANDLAAATALLDARFLIGDRALADRFLTDYRAAVASTAAENFVARLREEQKKRHSRYGATIFLLEPDLKNGPGGMRDLCMGRWATVARFGTSDPRRLQDLGVMTERLATAFEAAREWLLRIRIAMHTTAGRRQDQLRFALQEALAPVLCPNVKVVEGDIRPAVHPAVEALMHQFHAHAKLIRRETERLMARAAIRDDYRRVTVPVRLRGADGDDPAFVLRDGAIEPKDDGVFFEKPSEMVRIFSAAIELDVPLALRTREMISEISAGYGEALLSDPDTGRRFVEVVSDISDRASPTRLEEMHDLGLLSALMPEWEPSSGRVQHDIYHVYTVDQHALYAIARMHALARGDLADEFPAPTEAIRAVERPVALFIGTLLHDVGKPWGKPHSDIGADLTVKIALRLGIEEEDITRAEFLVRQHLVMGQMSQRRDLEDLEMIADFAKLCDDEENLRELYLLTFCDLSSVAPDNLTNWKETLLRELYQRTRTVLRRGGDLLGAERAEIIERRQQRAAQLLAEQIPEAASADLFRGLPDRYFAENSASRVASHMRLLDARRRAGTASAIEVAHQKRLEVTEMALAARDAPGLLADVAGVLYANRINIVDAAIYSRLSGPDAPAEALDIFRVRDSYGRPVTDEARWAKIRADLEAVLSGKTKVEALVAARPRGDSIASWKVPEVPLEIKIDNQGSRNFTIVEVITGDYPGVLYTIARTLFDQGLDIHRSKIATEANRVVDTFYVRARGGEKVTDDKAVAGLRKALKESLPSGSSVS